MAENKYKSAIEEVKAGIKAIVAEMSIADTQITELAGKAAKLGNAFKINTPDGLTNMLKEQTYLLKLLSVQLEKQTTNTNKLTNAKKQLVTLTGKEKVNNRELARNADLYAQSTSKLVGAYGNLIAKQKMAKRALHDLIAAEKQNTAEIKKAQTQYNKYTQRVNQAKRATSNFSKNSLGGLVKGFRSLLGAFGIVGATTIFASFARDAFNLTKKLQSLRFALNTVVKDAQDLARVQSFLSEISNKYGADIVTITERYTKFVAAAQQSFISLEKTEQIFESVTKASGVLGLKTDELTGVYLALEQMLSKGKVTTEELRRQLGERLPGAFGIMAAALDVSVPKLDEMLKKGEILSADALPKFAKALEEAYGIENVERIDTIVAAQTRLSNSYKGLIGSLTSGGTGDFGVAIFNTLALVLDRVSEGIATFKSALEDIGTAAKIVWGNFKDLINTLDPTGETLSKITAIFKILYKEFTKPGIEVLATTIKILTRAFVGLDFVLKEVANTFIAMDWTSPIENAKRLLNLIGSIGEVYEKGYNSVDQKNAEEAAIKLQKERNDVLNRTASLMVTLSKINGGNITKEQALLELSDKTTKGIREYNKYLIQQLKIKSEAVEEDTKTIKAREGSIGFLEAMISKLKDEQKNVATTSEEYQILETTIRGVTKELKRLQDEFDFAVIQKTPLEDLFDLDVSEGELNKAFNSIFEITDEGNKSGIEIMVENAKIALDNLEQAEDEKRGGRESKEERHRKKIDNLVKTTFDTFAEYYDLDLEKFEFLYNGKENKLQEWITAFDAVIDSALDASLNRYEVELQTAQRNRDLITNNELSTEKEKRIAREKFEEEERRIKTERAKKERQNTLIKIAVDTAASIASALAPPPLGFGPVAGLAAIPILASIGAAQAALVASQPIPKFAEGTKAPLSKDTLALVGDGGRSEAITENGKLVGVTPDKPTLMNLKKGQEVQKDANDWINNAVYRMNMESNGEMLSSVIMDNIMHDEIRKMRLENKKTWEEVKRLASRPISVNNRVVVESKYEEYTQ